MSLISIKKVSITALDTDAVVNAANDGLRAGGGVCGAIFAAAGREKLQKACSRIGHCDTGSAVITPGFDLNARYIIHAVGPRWTDGRHGEPELLYAAYRRSLELAAEHGCRSISFPLISAGIFGYPVREAWKKPSVPAMIFWKLKKTFLWISFLLFWTIRSLRLEKKYWRHMMLPGIRKQSRKKEESLIRLRSPAGNTMLFSSICRKSQTGISAAGMLLLLFLMESVSLLPSSTSCTGNACSLAMRLLPGQSLRRMILPVSRPSA